MRISKNFKRSEFSCSCNCNNKAVDIELVSVLQKLIADLEKASSSEIYIIITGGNRCADHNTSVGGAPNSMHIYSIACDFMVFRKGGIQIDPDFVADILESEYPNKYGIGRYSNRTHLDIRETKARWRVK